MHVAHLQSPTYLSFFFFRTYSFSLPSASSTHIRAAAPPIPAAGRGPTCRNRRGPSRDELHVHASCLGSAVFCTARQFPRRVVDLCRVDVEAAAARLSGQASEGHAADGVAGAAAAEVQRAVTACLGELLAGLHRTSSAFLGPPCRPPQVHRLLASTAVWGEG
jgi:hypothetical protein